MTETPETDKCVKQNKHLKFLQENVWVNDNKITYENPIVFLCQKLERERDEARETVESLTTTAFDLLASLEKARDERDRYKFGLFDKNLNKL